MLKGEYNTKNKMYYTTKMLNKLIRKIRMKLFRTLQEGDINIDELRQLVNEGAILLDVRSIQEYKEGHLPGAIQFADFEINKKTKELQQYKDRKIVLYCKSGSRSRKAYENLKRQGFKNIYNLYGGLDNLNYEKY